MDNIYKAAPENLMRALENLNYSGALDDDGNPNKMGRTNE